MLSEVVSYEKGHAGEYGLHSLPFLNFPLLLAQESLVHASLLKGKGQYTSLTLEHDAWGRLARQASTFCHHVAKNEALSFCWVKQCHSCNILVVSAPGEQNTPADAMITKATNLGLMVLHADCQALLFFDPIEKVIAAAHVGWRGSAVNLPALVVEKMQRDFQVNPENLLVVLSPSLGPCHAYYPQYKEHLPENIWPYQPQENYFDFWALTRDQLLHVGVLSQHIQNARLCTFAHEEGCFSYRREGKLAGRHASFIAMRS